MKESVENSSEVKELFEGTRSFHVDAELTDEFIDEIYREIKGLKEPPKVEEKFYQPFSVVLKPPTSDNQTSLDVVAQA